jgi:hypothetical protein
MSGFVSLFLSLFDINQTSSVAIDVGSLQRTGLRDLIIGKQQNLDWKMN